MTPAQTITLPPGFNRPSAVLYHDDRLYIGGRTVPAWLASVRASDLGDFKYIQFPAELHPGSGQDKYNVVLQMAWLGDELLVLFSGSSQLTIAAVDPAKWTWRELISTVEGNDILSFWVSNAGDVFVSGYGQGNTIGCGLITSFVPPSFMLTEWLVPNVISQYSPCVGSGDHLYNINGDTNASLKGEFMVTRWHLAAGVPKTVNTPGLRMVPQGPDVVEYGGYFYLSHQAPFYGSDRNVPPDELFRVNKTTLLVEKFIVGGASKGAIWDFWADGSNLWLLRTGTLTRYDGNSFEHFDLGLDRPELITGDNAGNLLGVERTNPIEVMRYPISGFKPTPAFILGSDENSLILGDGRGARWQVPASPITT